MGSRLPSYGMIDRAQPRRFVFDGVEASGFAGDTIASALMANGFRIVGRSFKYHRPRGIWGSWTEEPNAIVDVRIGGAHFPNCRATTELLREGMEVHSVNAIPNALKDRMRFLDRFSRFIPAAFYYKTFMWPDWHRFEPRIRHMAGLGRIDPGYLPSPSVAQINLFCDVLIAGAGPAGLAAALEAVKSGRSVILADDRPEPGGSLLSGIDLVEKEPAANWVSSRVAEIKSGGGRVFRNTTAYGVYDHGLVCLNQKHGGNAPDSLYRVRTNHLILATGAIERPLLHANNDRPGVMSADAALNYLARYGVLAGRRVVIATNNDSAYRPALALSEAGAEVTVLDARSKVDLEVPPSVKMIAGTLPSDVTGKFGVEHVRFRSGSIEADVLAVSGGWSPAVHLYCQARGKLRWNDELAAFVPGDSVENISVIGGANGRFDVATAIDEGRGLFGKPSGTASSRKSFSIVPAWGNPEMKGRIWIDFQNDVTVKDIALAARENFRSVEHLKRYTTLGMATDQGKTSNVNGLATMAMLTGREISEVGTTTFRPPYVPVPLSTIGGWRSGEFMNPIRRQTLEREHREAGAIFREYGGWLRPAWFGGGEPYAEIQREARHARDHGVLFDGSTLGKIEVIGPDAAKFLDFQYYNTVSSLNIGRIRYGFMLTEGGVVYDDGVLARLAENHFVVSCSSSHVAGVHARLETWRQDIFDPKRIQIHNATSQWATLTAMGPAAKELIGALQLGAELDDDLLPHMALTSGWFEGKPVRISRVSFTGDRSYEVSVPSGKAPALWALMVRCGRDLGMAPMGSEALTLLRAEKGYIIIGKDTDGTTMPHDLGVSGPLHKKQCEYLGKRSLFTETAKAENRKQLVGLEVSSGADRLPTGAHAVIRIEGKRRSIGYVTSSYYSPNLGRPIALGLVENGFSLNGEEVEIYHLGSSSMARIAPACAFDPENKRLSL